MRFILITMAAIAGLALGQTQGGINLPPCAVSYPAPLTQFGYVHGHELFEYMS